VGISAQKIIHSKIYSKVADLCSNVVAQKEAVLPLEQLVSP